MEKQKLFQCQPEGPHIIYPRRKVLIGLMTTLMLGISLLSEDEQSRRGKKVEIEVAGGIIQIIKTDLKSEGEILCPGDKRFLIAVLRRDPVWGFCFDGLAVEVGERYLRVGMGSRFLDKERRRLLEPILRDGLTVLAEIPWEGIIEVGGEHLPAVHRLRVRDC